MMVCSTDPDNFSINESYAMHHSVCDNSTYFIQIKACGGVMHNTQSINPISDEEFLRINKSITCKH